MKPKAPILLAVISVIAFAVSCAEDVERRSYQLLADELNPIVDKLHHAASGVLTAKPNEHAAIVDACWSSSDALRELSYIEALHADGARQLLTPAISIDREADALRFDRFIHCNRLDDDAVKQLCSARCTSGWASLRDEIDRVRAAARGHGVEIHSLIP